MSRATASTADASPAASSDALPPAAAAQPEGAERVVTRLLRTLQRARIPFWVIDGYGDGTFDPVDVDVLCPRAALPDAVADTLHAARHEIGASLISWDRDNQFVLACDGDAAAATFLRVHLRPDYRRVGRFFYNGGDVLATQPRRRADNDPRAFATPVSPREFACYLIEKIAKACLAPAHERVLTAAFANDPDGCAKEIGRFWAGASAALIESAARSGNWEIVRRAQRELRDELRGGAFVRRPFWTVAYKLSKGVRRLVEFARPSGGLHVVLLGPDGVGKSTVVEQLQRDLAPAFCGIAYGTFAPGLLPRKPSPEGAGGQPHGKPPRSLPASVVKALWWIVYYSLGYHFTIRPVLARGGLALNHRYCVDAIVDSRRYRYRGPRWLLTLAWRLARKPDLVFLLDAPPEVVQSRKREVAFEETVRQRDAYRKLVEPMASGRVIDATRPIADVVADVEREIVRFMSARTARRLGLSSGSAAAAAAAASTANDDAALASATAAAVALDPDSDVDDAPPTSFPVAT